MCAPSGGGDHDAPGRRRRRRRRRRRGRGGFGRRSWPIPYSLAVSVSVVLVPVLVAASPPAFVRVSGLYVSGLSMSSLSMSTSSTSRSTPLHSTPRPISSSSSSSSGGDGSRSRSKSSTSASTSTSTSTSTGRNRQLSARTESAIGDAMLLSQEAASESSSSADSLRLARRAADAWGALLDDADADDDDDDDADADDDAGGGDGLPGNVEAIGRVMLGHALARCGRDSDAVDSYSRAAAMAVAAGGDGGSSLPLREARMGCGKAMQRLMRYREARDVFFVAPRGLGVVATGRVLVTACAGSPHSLSPPGDADDEGEESSRDDVEFDVDFDADALRSAVTCSLRLGDVRWAKLALLLALDLDLDLDLRRRRHRQTGGDADGGGVVVEEDEDGRQRRRRRPIRDGATGDPPSPGRRRDLRDELAGLLGAVLWMDRATETIHSRHPASLSSSCVDVDDDDNDGGRTPPPPPLDDVVGLLGEAAAPSSPLYAWLHHLAKRKSESSDAHAAHLEERGQESKKLGDEESAGDAPPSSSPSSPWPARTALDRFLAALRGETSADGAGKRRSEDADLDRGATISALADVNHGPLDFPQLVRLDDKLVLHRMLTTSRSSSSHYYPRTFVLPAELDAFRRYVASSEAFRRHVAPSDEEGGARRWMLKEPAGYGSHGNRVVTEGGILEGTLAASAAAATDVLSEESTVLCQKMVHPPLLLDGGRKFSVRVYVMLLLTPPPSSSDSVCGGVGDCADGARLRVFVSREGLVKFAESPLRGGCGDVGGDEEDDAEMHMTNSARAGGGGGGGGRRPQQRDLAYLEGEFAKRGWDYSEFWDDVHSIVRSVLLEGDDDAEDGVASRVGTDNGATDHHRKGCNHWMGVPVGRVLPRRHMSQLSIPKILGFDFLLDDGTTDSSGTIRGDETTGRRGRRKGRPRPWLIEINRFPGLRPRDDRGDDGRVKADVVDGAWRLTSRVVGVDPRVIGLPSVGPLSDGGEEEGGGVGGVFEELRGAPSRTPGAVHGMD